VTGRLPRGSLDRSLILETAERLSIEFGLANVTIRRVAAALGVQHTAVHHHFARRGDLVDALLGRAVRRFNDRLPVVTSDDWAANLHDYWTAFREVLRSDTALFEMVVGEWVTMGGSPEALASSYQRIDAQLADLLRAGFSPEQAGYAYHLLSNYTRGCLLSERQFRQHPGGTLSAQDRPATLPGDMGRYAALEVVAARNWSYTFASDDDFEQGLSIIIRGLCTWLGPAED